MTILTRESEMFGFSKRKNIGDVVDHMEERITSMEMEIIKLKEATDLNGGNKNVFGFPVSSHKISISEALRAVMDYLAIRLDRVEQAPARVEVVETIKRHKD